jgi:hypothetical protein
MARLETRAGTVLLEKIRQRGATIGHVRVTVTLNGEDPEKTLTIAARSREPRTRNQVTAEWVGDFVTKLLAERDLEGRSIAGVIVEVVNPIWATPYEEEADEPTG